MMVLAEIHRRALGEHVVLLEIDSPPANALGSALRAAMNAALDSLERDTDVRTLVLNGRGSAFCSGDDLKEQEAAQGTDARRAQLGEFARVLERIARLRMPVIAAVNGWCIGGGLELALCCDMRIASNEAKFVCAGVNIGLIASAWRLPRLIGEARAKKMLFTGSPYDAATAERFGLVTAVHAPDELIGAALALAERIAGRAPLSIEATKRMASAADMTEEDATKASAAELDLLMKS